MGPITAVLDTGGHTNPPLCLTFSPDGKKLVSIDTWEVHVWKTNSGERERTWRLPLPLHVLGTHNGRPFWNYVSTVAVAPDNKTLAVVSMLQTAAPTKFKKPGLEPRVVPVWLLDLDSGDSRRINLPSPQLRGIDRVVFSPDGKRLAWIADQLVGVYDLGLNRITHNLKHAQGSSFTRVSFSKDSKRLFAFEAVYELAPVDAADKLPIALKPLFRVAGVQAEVRKHGYVADFCWSPDGSRFADVQAGASESSTHVLMGAVRFWTANGQPQPPTAHRKFSYHARLDFLEDGRLSVAGFDVVDAAPAKNDPPGKKPKVARGPKVMAVKVCIIDPATGKMDLERIWPTPLRSPAFARPFRPMASSTPRS